MISPGTPLHQHRRCLGEGRCIDTRCPGHGHDLRVDVARGGGGGHVYVASDLYEAV